MYSSGSEMARHRIHARRTCLHWNDKNIRGCRSFRLIQRSHVTNANIVSHAFMRTLLPHQ